MTYWNDAQMAQRLRCPLEKWRLNMERFLKPDYMFLASGTWSDPALNPLAPEIPIINAGVHSAIPYDYFRRQYSICAMMAAAYHVLNRNDWDLFVTLDYDALIGAVNFPKLIGEFMDRPETYLAPRWYEAIGGPFMAWKPESLARLTHYRLHPNLCDLDAPERPQVWERECTAIYGPKRWWNPWPQFQMLVYHDPRTQDPVAQDWPFVDRAPESLFAPYAAACTSRAVPLP